MKVAGKFIKSRRLNYGMSQRSLASGICAQATISLIENQNNCPNLEILSPICHRLKISIKSTLNVGKRVKDIEQAILMNDYEKAREICYQISKRKFQRHHHLGEYYCYQGTFSIHDRDCHNALYFFNNTLHLNLGSHEGLYRAWADLGLGLTYLKQRDLTKSIEFVRRGHQELKRMVKHVPDDQFKLFIQLRLLMGELLNKLGRYRSSNVETLSTISILVKNHTMYRLDKAYLLLNRNFSNLNLNAKAKLALNHAKVFREIYKNPKTLWIR